MDDDADLRFRVTEGWQHLDLSYEQVMAVRSYQYGGADYSVLPAVLVERREALLDAADDEPESEPEPESTPEEPLDLDDETPEPLEPIQTPIDAETTAGIGSEDPVPEGTGAVDVDPVVRRSGSASPRSPQRKGKAKR